MSKKQIYLKLAPEFGGERYGPIERPEYRLGSAEGNEVQLAEGLGIEPFHVRLIRRGGETFHLAPVERSAAVWVYRKGSGSPVRLYNPMVIQVGDSFSLVTTDGVRFTLIAEEVARPRKGQAAGPAGPGMPDAAGRYGGRLVSEVWRRMRAAALATYFGRMIQNTWFFVRTGQIFSPLYIIGFLTMFSGWGFGLQQCSSGRGATAKAATMQEKHEDCRKQLAGARAVSSGSSTPTSVLIGKVLDDGSWATSLQWGMLADAVTDEMAVLFTGASRVQRDWYVGTQATYPDMVDSLGEAGFEDQAARVIAWAGVQPLAAITPLLQDVETPEGASTALVDVRLTQHPGLRACVRGPMRLSAAQGHRLGLDVTLDVFHQNDAYAVLQGTVKDDPSRGYDLLQEAIDMRRGNIGLPVRTNRSIDALTDVTFPAGTCSYFKNVPDQRQSYGRVARKLAEAIGPDARGLPAINDTNGLTARLVKLYLLDLPSVREGRQRWEITLGSELDADLAPLISDDRAAATHVATLTAKVIARAVAIPCIHAIRQEWPQTLGPKAPDFDTCAILMARADVGKL